MSRESSIVQSLVDLADSLVDDYDVIDLLTGLTDRCVDLLEVTAAGVMLSSPPGELRVVASSSEAMRVLELLELQAQHGPCLDAFRTGQPVREQYLEGGSDRWPTFASAAVAAGFRSALALPLRLRDVTIGAMNLLNDRYVPVQDADLVVAQAFADLATISILQHRAATEAERVHGQLNLALTSRVVIEQAKGIIAERAGTDLPEAFARLRKYARDRNLLLTDVAKTAVDGTLDPAAWS